MTILRVARIIANRISHSDPGPAPKTIGIGPMKMIAPELVEPPRESTAATRTSNKPTMVKENPRMNMVNSFGDAPRSGSEGWGVSRVFKSFPRLRRQKVQHHDKYYQKCCKDYREQEDSP